MFDLTPGLLALGLLGLGAIWHRLGAEYAVLLVGSLLYAFLASALGRYPIATRLMLFSAPLLCIMIGTGMVLLAESMERWFSPLRARWVLLLLLYPSLVVAAALTFTQPTSWGVGGVAIRPLAEVFQRQGGSEPVYVFARSLPAWLFHTTDWTAPDSLRLTLAARVAGPGGPGFANAPSRGRRIREEGADLVYRLGEDIELYGTPTGSQARAVLGHLPRHPDAGWAESEASRIREAARPFIWLVFSDFVHSGTDERSFLMAAVKQAGAEIVYTMAAPDAVLYRVRF